MAFDIAAVLDEISKLRLELGGKMDKMAEQLITQHGQLEQRVRELERFKAWAVGAMAAVGVLGAVLGSVIGWAIRVSH